MINLSFNISDNITKNIRECDMFRQKFLLHPISPISEIKSRWHATLEKIYWGLTLADNPLSKKQMLKLISNSPSKKMTLHQKEVFSYKNTIDHIRNEWTASNNLLTPKEVLHIYDLSCRDIFGPTNSYFKSKEDDVLQILKYVESGKDHPIIKAGLIQIEMIKLSPFENGTGRVARLLSHLILAKYGYDLRGTLILEDYYRTDIVTLKSVSKSVKMHKNATIWLEYFSQGVLNGMQKALSLIQSSKPNNSIPNNYWTLNERLKRIIDLLEDPLIKITNKDVQKKFKVSQITASRDLTKLTSMGILLSHGKGRSVTYTKI